MNRKGPQLSMGVAPLTPAVKWLLILNVGIWLIAQVILEGFMRVPVSKVFGLYPGQVLFELTVWQVFSYMFLHTLQVTHILFNMLMLWFFGAELEQRWGSRQFVIYYLVCGVGAALLYILGMGIYGAVTGNQSGLVIPVIGASGAIFGLLLAHGLLFGERMVYFFMLFPMKTKYFVMILGFVEFASLLTSSVSGGEVAYLAHLSGLVSGYLYLKFMGSWQRRQWNKKAIQKHKGRSLRLVVDNEKNDEPKDGPKYWN